jgi:hypothetical protein
MKGKGQRNMTEKPKHQQVRGEIGKENNETEDRRITIDTEDSSEK